MCNINALNGSVSRSFTNFSSFELLNFTKTHTMFNADLSISSSLFHVDKKEIKLIYFADPVCSDCWTLEPYLQRLLNEYQSLIEIDYKMGGFLDSWETYKSEEPDSFDKTAYVRKVWRMQSEKFGIAMEESIWEKCPVASSTPASIAFYSAKRQGTVAAVKFLQCLREMLFMQGKDISQEHTILTAATQAHLDISLFFQEIHNGNAKSDFEKDQLEKQQWGVESFPTFVFVNSKGNFEISTGFDEHTDLSQVYQNWEAMLNHLTDNHSHKRVQSQSVLDLLKKHNRLSLSELVIISGLPETVVQRDLFSLYFDGLIIKEYHSQCVYWRRNETSLHLKKKNFKFTSSAVLGGGICGYYLLNCLEICGHDTRVFERQEKDAFKGLGFIILKNGIEAMDLIGKKNELFKQGNAINRFRAITPTGNVIYSSILEDCVAIGREEFYNVLKLNIRQDEVHFEKEVKSVELNEQKTIERVLLHSGETVQASVYFGSDGIRSKLRTQLFPNAQLQPLSEREIVGMVTLSGFDLKTDEFLKVIDAENGKYLGLLPLGNDRYIWFLQLNQETHPVLAGDPETLREYVTQSVAHFPEVFRQLIAETDFSGTFLWSANRMDILPAFHFDNLVLAGDAAHPFLALTSQGANSAIEDAAVLVALLSHQQSQESVQDVFRAYYEMRKPVVQHHINEGDALVSDFLNLSKSQTFKLPLSIH